MNLLKKIIFCGLHILHTLCWGFVMFAFLNKQTAKINLYIIIPLIYILHVLPVHPFIEAKKLVAEGKSNSEKQLSKLNSVPILKQIEEFRKWTGDNCMFSPLSPQGMLLFGAISCLYRVYPLSFKQVFTR